MNKEDLITRIKDSKETDERDEKVFEKSFVYTTIVTQVFCIVFMVVNLISSIKSGTKANISDFVSLIFIQCAFSKLYQFKMTGKKLDICLFIIYFICTILSLMIYITESDFWTVVQVV